MRDSSWTWDAQQVFHNATYLSSTFIHGMTLSMQPLVADSLI